MADGTKIEWTDATWNVVNGCSVVSPGCTNCYAMRLAGTRLKNHPSRAGLTIDTKAGPVWTGETRFNDKVLLDPLRWKRPRRIFVCAHGDLFHDSVPDENIDRVFAVMALAPQHQFQVLTKRPARMLEYMLGIDNGGERLVEEGIRGAMIEGMAQKIWHERTGDESVDEWLAVHLPLPNVWLGTSVEDQARADERIPDLLATPASVRWISAEPLLGPVDLTTLRLGSYVSANSLNGQRFDELGDRDLGARIDWVVAGGESGPGARPMHPDWARSLRDQCAATSVPFLFKQWGGWSDAHAAPIGDITFSEGNTPGNTAWPDGTVGHGRAEDRGGPGFMLTQWHHKRDAGRLLDGVQHDGFPV